MHNSYHKIGSPLMRGSGYKDIICLATRRVSSHLYRQYLLTYEGSICFAYEDGICLSVSTGSVYLKYRLCCLSGQDAFTNKDRICLPTRGSICLPISTITVNLEWMMLLTYVVCMLFFSLWRVSVQLRGPYLFTYKDNICSPVRTVCVHRLEQYLFTERTVTISVYL